MKKFFANIYIFISLILASMIAIPWNDFTVWGLEIDFLTKFTDNEFSIKAIVLGIFFIFSLIFLFVSNREFKAKSKVSFSSAYATTLPLIGFGIAMLSHLTYTMYSATNFALGIGISNVYTLYVLGGGAVILLSVLFLYVFTRSFRLVSSFGRTAYFILFLLFASAAGVLSYLFKTNEFATGYVNMSAKFMVLIIPIALIIYFITIVMINKHYKNSALDEFDEQEQQFDEITFSHDGSIVTKENKIESGENLYQEVSMDPEFSKQVKQRNKPNSIDYYIEKPKMFKAINPTFDKLVSHVREFPNVIVKADDEKITFYVERRPFMVLMNYGDYYRMAFRYELEEGIRLIIKYPTISKNKSTREELWFKANNYGDLPKEIIYKIVKNAYDVVIR